MKGDIYKLYQDGKLFFKGDKEYLMEKTRLSKTTIDNYCRPGFLESTKNKNNNKVIKADERK